MITADARPRPRPRPQLTFRYGASRATHFAKNRGPSGSPPVSRVPCAVGRARSTALLRVSLPLPLPDSRRPSGKDSSPFGNERRRGCDQGRHSGALVLRRSPIVERGGTQSAARRMWDSRASPRPQGIAAPAAALLVPSPKPPRHSRPARTPRRGTPALQSSSVTGPRPLPSSPREAPRSPRLLQRSAQSPRCAWSRLMSQRQGRAPGAKRGAGSPIFGDTTGAGGSPREAAPRAAPQPRWHSTCGFVGVTGRGRSPHIEPRGRSPTWEPVLPRPAPTQSPAPRPEPRVMKPLRDTSHHSRSRVRSHDRISATHRDEPGATTVFASYLATLDRDRRVVTRIWPQPPAPRSESRATTRFRL